MAAQLYPQSMHTALLQARRLGDAPAAARMHELETAAPDRDLTVRSAPQPSAEFPGATEEVITSFARQRPGAKARRRASS